MRFYLSTLALLWAYFFAPCLVSATSIVPYINLADATLNSECVVLARAVENQVSTESNRTYLETKFESIELTKGVLAPGTSFSVRPFSRNIGKFQVDIAGDFKPEIGKTYLLFLNQRDNYWRPTMLSYYVFEQLQDGQDAFLVPLGSNEIELVKRPDGQYAEPLVVYKKDPLLQQLKAIADSPQLIWDGSKGRTSLHAEDFAALDRAVPTGCDFKLGGPNLSRWQDAAIPIFYDNDNNPANWNGIFSNVLSALSSNYAGIIPTNGGAVGYVPDCGGGSAIDGNFLDFCDNNIGGPQCALVVFEDPCNEIGDLNNCVGTLAIGGSYSSSDTHQFDNLPWDNALYGFVIVNNGVSTCLDDVQYERMLTHELTHVYRMGHLNATNYPNQNMNPVCCNAINTKDQECMNYAYPSPAPVELVSFNAQLEGEKQVKLEWITASENENAFFSVQRSGNGIQFDEIRQVPSSGSNAGGFYQFMDTRPLPGLNYYLLSQTDWDGKSQHLGIKAVTLGHDEKIQISPNPVNSQNLFFSLDMPKVFDGILEIMDTDGQVVLSTALSLEKGPQHLQQALGTLHSGLYVLQIMDGQQQWESRFIIR